VVSDRSASSKRAGRAVPWRRLVSAAVIVVAVFVAFAVLRSELGLEPNHQSLRDAVGRVGLWAPLAYVLVVAFRVPLLVPSQLVLLGGGLLFGTAAGTLYGALGLLLSAVVLFIGCRWAGREVVDAKVPERLRPVHDIAGGPAGALFIAVGTGYPFGPVTMYHMIAGVTPMTLVAFGAAAAVGSMIRSLTFTYLGSSLVSGEWEQLLQAAVLLGLGLFVPLLFERPRAWLRQIFRAEGTDGA
jgi:uncharacterized membrane protein YdjX (TVP38/TMEM64 family)